MVGARAFSVEVDGVARVDAVAFEVRSHFLCRLVVYWWVPLECSSFVDTHLLSPTMRRSSSSRILKCSTFGFPALVSRVTLTRITVSLSV